MCIASLTDKPVAKKIPDIIVIVILDFKYVPTFLIHSRLLSAVRRNLDSSSAPVVQKVDRAIISYPLNTLYQVDNAIGWINT